MWRSLLVVFVCATVACVARESETASAGADSAAGLFLPPQPVVRPSGPPEFSYAGVAVPAAFDSLAARYPRARRADQTLYLSDAEIHDRITAIGYVEDPGGWQTVDISFDRLAGRAPGRQGARPEPASRRYPRCDQILPRITERYGEPDSLKQFTDNTYVRADRYWNRPGELMKLLCIFENNVYYARALTLERFPQ